MAFAKQNNLGQFEYVPQKMTVQEYDNYNGPVQNKAIQDPSSMRSYAEQMADSSNGRYTANDAKYLLASKTAQERFKDVDGIDDNRMKQEIDNIYENELGATNTGREQRGENSVTDVIGGIKDFFGTVNNGIGSGLDWVFDNTVGNLAGLADEQWGNDLKNAFTGEDLSIVPDIAEDVLLSMIPGAGIPLVVAKNAIQQSDNIAEAISGKDNITKEDLDGWQQAGKIGEAILGTGLAALPGIGVLRNAGKYTKGLTEAENAAKKAIAESGETPGSVVSKAITNSDKTSKVAGLLPESKVVSLPTNTLGFVDDVTKGTKDTIKALKESYPKAIQYDLEKATEAFRRPSYTSQVRDSWNKARGLMKPSRINGKELDSINSKLEKLKADKKAAKKSKDTKKTTEIQGEIDNLKAQRGDWAIHPIQATRTVTEGLLPRSNAENYAKLTQALEDPANSKSLMQKIANVPVVGGLGSYAADVGRGGLMAAGAAATAEMGETGVDPITALGQSLGRFATDPGAYGAMLVPLGARKLAMSKAPTVKGNYNSRLPYQMLRAGAITDRVSDMAQSDIYSSYDENEMFDRLRAAIDRNNNGV